MWKGQKISVVLPTYNEKESIRQCINDFFATKVVDEIIVVNNNAAPGTSEEIKKTKARLVYEPKQGYGYSIQKGLAEAKGDLIIISEPDGTFEAKDIFKFLAYSEDIDVVSGTRTTQALLWKDANMGIFLKWGNWFIAKLVEFMFNTTHLSDVGCTYKLIKKDALDKIINNFRIGGSSFGVEMMLLIVQNKEKIIEI
ncbi:MAG: glycosyltransferase family 2 protein, partial [Candidatus Aenigmarchaeota archaeon]|nr:glycosyltransferase family 2 protein [Candidatus Aenigmarchaeota archaeon]